MPKNALVLMTAMPPTVGHQHLIEFAREFVRIEGGQVYVLLNTRPQEPLVEERIISLASHCDDPNITVYTYGKDVPQNPSEHPDFWNIWKDLVYLWTPFQPGDYVIASETYGLDLAKALDGEFVPCDIARYTVKSAATKVRQDIEKNYHLLLPEIKPMIGFTTTIFGSDSTGKTTISRSLAAQLNGTFVPEWAREYLKTCGEEVTDERMDRITRGQYAAQQAAKGLNFHTVQDTDLLSTVGYYHVYRDNHPDLVEQLAKQTLSDLYIVMNSNIPFEPDSIRYGIDHRESTDEFWEKILIEYGCNYHMVKNTHPAMQITEVLPIIHQQARKKYDDLRNFVRT